MIRSRRISGFLVILFSSLAGGGCVQRTLTIESSPPGALVYLNGLEVGRTPVTRDFTWYGTYDVQLRAEGHETLKTKGKVIAPWWQWVPFDLVAEVLPLRLRDEQHLRYTLRPTAETAADPGVMLERARDLRGQLESSPRTPAVPPLPAVTQPTAAGGAAVPPGAAALPAAAAPAGSGSTTGPTVSRPQ